MKKFIVTFNYSGFVFTAKVFIHKHGNTIVYSTQVIEDYLSYMFENKELIFSVTDTGIGIPKNKIASMFKPFVQGERYDTRTHGGVGLGLSIVKELVNLMKGTINVKSVLGTGSTFTITIPLE